MFPHAVFLLSKTDMNAEGLMYGYKKLFQFLGLSKTQQFGITMIVTPNWMFLCTIK